MNIEYEIKFNAGAYNGNTLKVTIPIEYVEDSLSSALIDLGYLDYWCNNGEYEIINREIV